MITKGLKKGIFFIPTLLTMGNILCGFFAIASAMHGNWLPAGIAIGIAFALDGLDGRIARMTDTQTEFGFQLDSLADVISFGVAPAILAYMKWLQSLERLGILLAFLFVCGAAMRLARFNAYDVEDDSSCDYFNGMPTPAAAGALVSLYFLEFKLSGGRYGVPAWIFDYYSFIIPIMLLVLSYLMLSNLKYPTFKNIAWGDMHPTGILFPLLFLVIVSALFPFYVFTLFFLGYLLSGPLNLGRFMRLVISDDLLKPENVDESTHT
jgi:CDP-diacylglycerol--serine O-phosphatidyltransferase